MKEIEIYCDFNTKATVKELGCKWNSEKGFWVCPLNNSAQNILLLMTMQRWKVIHFIKEIVNDHDARNRKDCFKPNYKLCYHIVEYNEDDIMDLHINYNKTNENFTDLFIDD